MNEQHGFRKIAREREIIKLINKIINELIAFPRNKSVIPYDKFNRINRIINVNDFDM